MSYRREPKVSDDTWILVADRAKAIFFHATWPELDQLRELHHFINPEGASQRDDSETDRPGRFMGFGQNRHAVEPQTDFKHRTATDFAVQIVDKLEHGRTNNEFGRLIIVAPPLMLGVLREHLSAPLTKTVTLEISKGLVDANLKELTEHVRDGLAARAETVNGR